MFSIKNILVPRDFSECGEAAVGDALELAQRAGATVHLLFVEVLYADAYAPAVHAASNEVLIQRLRKGIKEETPGDPVQMKAVVRRDIAAAPAIVTYAEEEDVDLIVMGTHGRRGLRRLLLGSAAEEVVRTAPCPVIITHCKEKPPAGEAEAPSLLVPIDFSKHSRIALRHAKALAELYHARLDLLHIIEEQLHPAFYNTGVFSVYDMVPNIEERAREELETFYKETEGPDIAARFHVCHGHAAHEIVTFARKQRPLLIVMATHGLRGMEHLLLGSVAEKVVRLSPTPVFTIKAFGKKLVPEPTLTEATAFG